MIKSLFLNKLLRLNPPLKKGGILFTDKLLIRRKGLMDEKTSLLICLGASTAANCIPCFEHYHKKASAVGLTSEEILEAVELASKVKSGAHLVLRNSVKILLGEEASRTSCGCGPSPSSCCDS
jgi:hypothetical protein